MADRIELGSVVGVFGVRGEVRLHLHNREDSVLKAPRRVVLVSPEGEERVATVSIRPGAGKRIIGQVDGIATPEDAAALMGFRVFIDRDQLPPLPDGEFYVADLVGMPLEDEDGTVLGTLSEVISGDRDVWVIATDGEDAFLLPGAETVLRIDAEAGVIVVARGALAAGE